MKPTIAASPTKKARKQPKNPNPNRAEVRVTRKVKAVPTKTDREARANREAKDPVTQNRPNQRRNPIDRTSNLRSQISNLKSQISNLNFDLTPKSSA